jgi:membrane-associated phospholipid phosphatase
VTDAWRTATLFARLLEVDELATHRLNSAVRRWQPIGRAASFAADWSATAEIVLMLASGAQGRHSAVVRMLAAVSTVYVASEVMGSAWQRERPFSRLDHVEGLIEHGRVRSFPSRHVASAVAMASISQGAQSQIGGAMMWLAVVLAVSRVATGVHFPSDVLVGGALGLAVGRLLR